MIKVALTKEATGEAYDRGAEMGAILLDEFVKEADYETEEEDLEQDYEEIDDIVKNAIDNFSDDEIQQFSPYYWYGQGVAQGHMEKEAEVAENFEMEQDALYTAVIEKVAEALDVPPEQVHEALSSDEELEDEGIGNSLKEAATEAAVEEIIEQIGEENIKSEDDANQVAEIAEQAGEIVAAQMQNEAQ